MYIYIYIYKQTEVNQPIIDHPEDTSLCKFLSFEILKLF